LLIRQKGTHSTPPPRRQLADRQRQGGLSVYNSHTSIPDQKYRLILMLLRNSLLDHGLSAVVILECWHCSQPRSQALSSLLPLLRKPGIEDSKE